MNYIDSKILNTVKIESNIKESLSDQGYIFATYKEFSEQANSEDGFLKVGSFSQDDPDYRVASAPLDDIGDWLNLLSNTKSTPDKSDLEKVGIKAGSTYNKRYLISNDDNPSNATRDDIIKRFSDCETIDDYMEALDPVISTPTIKKYIRMSLEWNNEYNQDLDRIAKRWLSTQQLGKVDDRYQSLSSIKPNHDYYEFVRDVYSQIESKYGETKLWPDGSIKSGYPFSKYKGAIGVHPNIGNYRTEPRVPGSKQVNFVQLRALIDIINYSNEISENAPLLHEPIKRTSSMGYPFFTSDIDLKMRVLNDVYKLVVKHKGNMSKIVEEFPNVYVAGMRKMIKSMNDKTVVNQYFQEVPNDRQRYNDLAPEMRLVFVGNMMNILFKVLYNHKISHIKHNVPMFDNTPEALDHFVSSIGSNEKILATDVSSFDASIPELYTKLTYEGVDDLGLGIYEYKSKQDYLSVMGESKPYVTSLRDIFGHANLGNNSGHFLVSWMAQASMTASALAVFRTIKKQLIPTDKFLNNESELKGVDNGDDYVWSGPTYIIDKVVPTYKDINQFVVTAEVPPLYCGQLVCKKGDGSYYFKNNIPKILTNLFCSESGYHEKSLTIALDAYRDMLGDDFLVIEDTFKKYYGRTLTQWVLTNDEIELDEELEQFYRVGTDTEKAVIMDNDKLLWKFDWSDISPELAEKLFANVTPSEIKKMRDTISRMLSGEEVVPEDITIANSKKLVS